MNKRCTKDLFVEGAIFHIYNKSIDPFKLFYTYDDYRWFTEMLISYIIKIPSTVFAYCLMPNHFHFLIRQNGDIPVYELFNRLCSSYVRHLNHNLNRQGRLFENKLQHIPVNKERYLIRLATYIHNNPVKAGLVSKPENWSFSNYSNYINKKSDRLTEEGVLRLFENYLDDYENIMIEYSSNIREQKKYLLIDDD